MRHQHRHVAMQVDAVEFTEAFAADQSLWPQWLRNAYTNQPGPSALWGLVHATGAYRLNGFAGAQDISWGDWIVRKDDGMMVALTPKQMADKFTAVDA